MYAFKTSVLRAKSAQGFTLLELIAVMIVLGVVGTLGTQFIVSAVDGYREAQARQRLVDKGRTSIEQITRYVRAAVPNSVRASASGQCVELMPTVGAAFYEGQVADSQNGAASTSALDTSPFSLGIGAAEHAVVGALVQTEVYSAGSPSARADIAATSGSPITNLSFSLAHRFVRNSINNRVYIGDDPVRFCLSSGNLVIIEDYGIEVSLADGNPGGVSALMADSVAAAGTAFALSAGTEDRNSVLEISLNFAQGNNNVDLNQTVFIRNVP